MASFLETKHHINKPTQTYTCELINRGKDWVVLRYVSDSFWRIEDTELPKNTTTLALYERDAQCVLWRMTGPDMALRGHLFHLCTDIEIKNDGVEYLDQLLDVWIDHKGDVTILDQDELAECVALKKLSHHRAHEIEKAAQDIVKTWQTGLARLDARLT
jgi:hypothetical protein